jgi:queuine tRNA-ribosyltransferase
MREQSARELAAMDFDGYAIGGVSVGEPEEEMFRAIDNAVPFLPENKPRYAMGLGTPPQILEMIGRGVDMFDCVMPTRVARHGTAFTLDGPIQIKNLAFAKDPHPLCETSHPHVARFSRAYIRHLFRAGEILSLRLLSFHNLHFYLCLVSDARAAIANGTFVSFKNSFIKRYLKLP